MCVKIKTVCIIMWAVCIVTYFYYVAMFPFSSLFRFYVCLINRQCKLSLTLLLVKTT